MTGTLWMEPATYGSKNNRNTHTAVHYGIMCTMHIEGRKFVEIFKERWMFYIMCFLSFQLM